MSKACYLLFSINSKVKVRTIVTGESSGKSHQFPKRENDNLADAAPWSLCGSTFSAQTQLRAIVLQTRARCPPACPCTLPLNFINSCLVLSVDRVAYGSDRLIYRHFQIGALEIDSRHSALWIFRKFTVDVWGDALVDLRVFTGMINPDIRCIEWFVHCASPYAAANMWQWPPLHTCDARGYQPNHDSVVHRHTGKLYNRFLTRGT